MQFTDLPPDIYTDLVHHLAPLDSLALLSTCKALSSYLDDQTYAVIFRQLYPHEPIVDAIPREHGWLYYLNLRTRGRLYTWGESLRARLGYSSTDTVFQRPNRAVVVPKNVESFNRWSIRLIHSTGFSFIVQLQPEAATRAQLYYTGYHWRDTAYTQDVVPPGPNVRDFASSVPRMRHTGIIELPGRVGTTFIRRMPNPVGYEEPETAYVSPLLIGGEEGKNSEDPIIRVDCGRQHIMAMTALGRLWTWDTGVAGFTAVELDVAKVIASFSRSQDEDVTIGESERLHVTEIRCSWTSNSCYVPGLGIIFWNGREPVTEESSRNVDFSYWATLVPETQYVTDFCCVFNDIVYIDSTGRNICVFRDGETEVISSVSLDKLAPVSAEDYSGGTDSNPEEYVRLQACYERFIASTNRSRTVVYNVKQQSGETVELPEGAAQLIDIVVGDYHYLALTADGELYAWGHESKGCGCLGVEATRTWHDLDVVKPTLVTKPASGKWLAVAAGGWQSAGVFVEC